jgi:sec-independent protein translocase protein TatB
MFDIGFAELVVIAIVALIVIGPQRLPKVARTLGHLLGRMQRYVNDVKADISREMELDELKKLQSSMEDTARSMREGLSETESELNKVAQSAKVDPYDNPFADPPAAPEGAQPPADPFNDIGGQGGVTSQPPSTQAELPLGAPQQPPAPKQG